MSDCGACGNVCKYAMEVCGGSCVSPTLYSGLSSVADIVVDDLYLYWVDNSEGTVNRGSKIGGAITKLATGQYTPSRIAMDATHLYWSNRTGAAIMRMPKTGGTPTIVAAAKEPFDLVLDDTRVYWLNRADGTFVSAPKAGGAMTTHATIANPAGSAAGAGIAVGGAYVYWADVALGTYQAPKAGGAPTLVIPTPSSSTLTYGTTAIGADADYVCAGMSGGANVRADCLNLSTKTMREVAALGFTGQFSHIHVVNGVTYVVGNYVIAMRMCDGKLVTSFGGYGTGGRPNKTVPDARWLYLATGNTIYRLPLRLEP